VGTDQEGVDLNALKNFRFWLVRIVMLLVFLSYYILMAAVNIGWIEAYLNPLKPFKGSVHVVSGTVFVGPYPDEMELERLRNLGVKSVVSVLDPEYPFVRELAQSEKEKCRQMGMVYINIPDAHLFDIMNLLKSHEETIYFHGYFETPELNGMVGQAVSVFAQ